MDIRLKFKNKNLHNFNTAKYKIRSSEILDMVRFTNQFTIVFFYSICRLYPGQIP